MALIVMLVLLWGQLRSLPSHIVSLLWTKHRWSVLHILTHLNSQQPYETDQNIPIVSMRTQRHREGRSPAQAARIGLEPRQAGPGADSGRAALCRLSETLPECSQLGATYGSKCFLHINLSSPHENPLPRLHSQEVLDTAYEARQCFPLFQPGIG